MSMALALAERKLVPDALIRFGIRRRLDRHMARERRVPAERRQAVLMEFTSMMRGSPIAVHTADANLQHYEVPARFFGFVLGPNMKYSCCDFSVAGTSLEAAEAAMLAKTCERAQLEDGMDILELGCGWGSLTLWMAERFPNSRITAVSNSKSQREFISKRATQRGLQNITVLTQDMNEFTTDQTFDRVVSVEMFEHMRNYEKLLAWIAGWLKPNGKLFIHIFTHRDYAYLYDSQGGRNWMATYFFTGGMMPSNSLLLYFQHDLMIEQHWVVSGVHYERTANAWLEAMDEHRAEIMPIMRDVYGPRAGARWYQRWRIFFMACAELWGYHGGNEWFVSHYLLRRK